MWLIVAQKMNYILIKTVLIIMCLNQPLKLKSSCKTKKKSSLVSGNRPGENHSPAHIVEYVSEYTFLISKNNKQTNKKTRIKENKRN